MITLHQFFAPPAHGSYSPFCLKLEAYLRMANMPYTTQRAAEPSGSPKHKLPYITDQGQAIGDSGLIIQHLATAHGVDLDQGLTARQKALSRAIITMLEEHVYFALVWARWIDDAVWPTTKQLYFGMLPPAIAEQVSTGARENVRRNLYGQGIGRHTPEEITALAEADLAALAELLGDGPWLHGDRPSRADASILAFVTSLLYTTLPTRLTPLAQAQPVLVAYRDRHLPGLFPEFSA